MFFQTFPPRDAVGARGRAVCGGRGRAPQQQRGRGGGVPRAAAARPAAPPPRNTFAASSRKPRGQLLGCYLHFSLQTADCAGCLAKQR